MPKLSERSPKHLPLCCIERLGVANSSSCFFIGCTRQKFPRSLVSVIVLCFLQSGSNHLRAEVDKVATEFEKRGQASVETANGKPAFGSDLRYAAIKALKRLDSLYIEYESSGYDTSMPLGTKYHAILAIKSPLYLYCRIGHSHSRMQWKDDPLIREAYANESFFINASPLSRTFWQFDMKPNEPLPSSFARDFFFLSTGIWPLSSRPAPLLDGYPYMLHDVLSSEDYNACPSGACEIDCKKSLGIDTSKVWVLYHSGHDYLWFDATKNCALLGRLIIDTKGEMPTQSFICKEHLESVDGLWIPQKVRMQEYHEDQTNKNRQVLRDGVVDFTTIKWAPLTKEFFSYKPPPGAVLQEFVDDIAIAKQITPGGLELMDELAKRYTFNSSHGYRQYWITSFAASVAGFMLGCVFLKCRKIMS